MRVMALTGLFAAQVACFGLSEDKFATKFADRYCEEQSACNAEFDCNEVDGGDENDECAFDKSAAKECLKAEWPCDDELGAIEIADACHDVCGASGSDEE